MQLILKHAADLSSLCCTFVAQPCQGSTVGPEVGGGHRCSHDANGREPGLRP